MQCSGGNLSRLYIPINYMECLACDEVLDGCNERLPIPRGHEIRLNLHMFADGE